MIGSRRSPSPDASQGAASHSWASQTHASPPALIPLCIQQYVFSVGLITILTPDELGRLGTLPRICSPTRSASTNPAALITSSILRDGSLFPVTSFFIDSIHGANAMFEHLA